MKKKAPVVPASTPRNPIVPAMHRVTKPGRHKQKDRTPNDKFFE